MKKEKKPASPYRIISIREEGRIKGVGKRMRSRRRREKMVGWDERSGKGGMEVFGPVLSSPYP